MIKVPVKKTVLVAPLDWGLGHATRCIPIIKQLEALGMNVLLAADGATAHLLKQEFPHLTLLPLEGYKITYTRQSAYFTLWMMAQLPRILITIQQEKSWLKRVVKKYQVDAVIADNRPGLYHPTITSIYITHQLTIKTASSFTARIATTLHRYIIKKFTSCWVPDIAATPGIAGQLSHPANIGMPVQYLGCISRFEKLPAVKKIYDLVAIISGPEPQRTQLETLLLSQLKQYKGAVLLVRGLPASNDELPAFSAPHISIKNHLTGTSLSLAIQQAKQVICRSGYTSIMDLLQLQQPAILVPTPGQPEQLYLAAHLHQQGWFFSTPQQGFNLSNVLREAEGFSSQQPCLNSSEYKAVVANFIQRLCQYDGNSARGYK
jgi:predicted glycosyltransferase